MIISKRSNVALKSITMLPTRRKIQSNYGNNYEISTWLLVVVGSTIKFLFQLAARVRFVVLKEYVMWDIYE